MIAQMGVMASTLTIEELNVQIETKTGRNILYSKAVRLMQGVKRFPAMQRGLGLKVPHQCFLFLVSRAVLRYRTGQCMSPPVSYFDHIKESVSMKNIVDDRAITTKGELISSRSTYFTGGRGRRSLYIGILWYAH